MLMLNVSLSITCCEVGWGLDGAQTDASILGLDNVLTTTVRTTPRTVCHSVNNSCIYIHMYFCVHSHVPPISWDSCDTNRGLSSSWKKTWGNDPSTKNALETTKSKEKSHTQFPFQDKVAIRRGGLKHLHSQSLNSTFILIVLQGSRHPVTLTSYMP